MIPYCFPDRNDVKFLRIGTKWNVNLWTAKIVYFKKTQNVFVNNFCVTET